MTENVISGASAAHDEQGFSVTEMLIVCAVILVVAALAVPALQKSIIAAENGKTYSAMRAIVTAQSTIYSQKSRFGTLSEINSTQSNAMGTISGNQLLSGKYVFEMVPANPTPAELRDGYVIKVVRNVPSEGVIYEYEVTQEGAIRQILPAPAPAP